VASLPRTNDPLQRGCALPKRYLTRIWRGHDPLRSEDITIVPAEPNYSGSFKVAAHSGPWETEQTVPLLLYGPGYIAARGQVDEAASVTDVYATAGRLTGVDLEPRSGKVLEASLLPFDQPPKLIVVIVWDGGGRGVLDRWAERTPNFRRLERDGVSYLRATVGSSPSITPATHATLGTGAFPRRHGVTAIVMGTQDDSVRNAFAGRNPRDLLLSTFGDQIDAAYGNASLVGMLAWKSWHMGMLGHGTALPGGDADHLALIGHGSEVSGNDEFYSTPTFADPEGQLERAAAEVDRSDGEADGKWAGEDILAEHDNPAWPRFEFDLTLEMLANEGYGRDAVPDIFVTNYKSSDLIAHERGIAAEELGDILEAQDEALGDLVDWLDENVGDYVVALTADHGFPAPPEETGAWPLQQGELERDVNEHFGVSEGSLIEQTTAVGPFLRSETLESAGVTETQIAEFLNGYTIRDNFAADQDLPDGYEDRAEELILAAAFPSADLPKVMDCAFAGTS
jgi:hypothetical protein